MKTILLIAMLMIVSCSKKNETPMEIKTVTEIKKDSTNHFGGELKLVGMEGVKLSEAVAKNMLDKDIRLIGMVTKSCAKKGCWMIMNDADKSVRITFKDYGFFVPLGFQDKNVLIEGVLKEEMISEADRKHFAEDAGKSKEDVDKIVGDEKQYTFVATSVLVI